MQCAWKTKIQNRKRIIAIQVIAQEPFPDC